MDGGTILVILHVNQGGGYIFVCTPEDEEEVQTGRAKQDMETAIRVARLEGR
jgi:hypothetical protein